MQTKRPLNECEDCGYTWHPRGKNVSIHCPHCRSTDISHWITTTSEPLFASWKLMTIGLSAIVLGLSLASIDKDSHTKTSDAINGLLMVGGGISFVLGYYSRD